MFLWWLEIYPSWLICCLLNSQLGFSMVFSQHMNLSKQKHLALSLSSSQPRPLLSSTKQQNENILKTKIVKFQDPKRSFELIYSIPYLTNKSFFVAEYTVRAALVTDLQNALERRWNVHRVARVRTLSMLRHGSAISKYQSLWKSARFRCNFPHLASIYPHFYF